MGEGGTALDYCEGYRCKAMVLVFIISCNDWLVHKDVRASKTFLWSKMLAEHGDMITLVTGFTENPALEGTRVR